jgi:UDP-N-acetylglucosamine 1-carboxyvinyltransferase
VVQGSKNAALPMIAASLLAEEGQTVLRRVPPVKDVRVALEVLRQLGAKVDYDEVGEVAVIDATGVNRTRLPEELTGRFRASLLFLGPLLGRFRQAWIQEVGGCAIGARPVDYHYRGFARLGAKVAGVGGSGIEVTADALQGAFMYCDLPSHTGVENLIMASCLAQGDSIIENAASDPEIVDFAALLAKMGARVEGAGTRTVRIRGVGKLHGTEHTVMYDRLDAGLLMMAGAITGGEIALKGVCADHLRIFEAKLHQMGVRTASSGEWTQVMAPGSLSPINVVTTFYPGFPTDLQPSIMALSCLARGDSYIRETVFEDRLGHVNNLRAFGARLSPDKDRLIVVHGPARLKGTRVRAIDIRAGGACVLAGLAAEGRTEIANLYQLDRGHARLEERLRGLGARLERVRDRAGAGEEAEDDLDLVAVAGPEVDVRPEPVPLR